MQLVPPDLLAAREHTSLLGCCPSQCTLRECTFQIQLLLHTSATSVVTDALCPLTWYTLQFSETAPSCLPAVACLQMSTAKATPRVDGAGS